MPYPATARITMKVTCDVKVFPKKKGKSASTNPTDKNHSRGNFCPDCCTNVRSVTGRILDLFDRMLAKHPTWMNSKHKQNQNIGNDLLETLWQIVSRERL